MVDVVSKPAKNITNAFAMTHFSRSASLANALLVYAGRAREPGETSKRERSADQRAYNNKKRNERRKRLAAERARKSAAK